MTLRSPITGNARPNLPLTLLPGLDPGIRGSLPLRARRERVGVRGGYGQGFGAAS
jgi:hypothetical protein